MYYWVENLNVQSLSNFVYVSFVYINKTNKTRRIYFIKFIFRWNSKKNHIFRVIPELPKPDPIPELPEFSLGRVTGNFSNMKNPNYPKPEKITRSTPLITHTHFKEARVLGISLWAVKEDGVGG